MNVNLGNDFKQSNRILKAVFPGKYFQGSGLLNELPELVKIFGIKGMILSSKTVRKKILSLPKNKSLIDNFIVEEFKGECSLKEINRIQKIVLENNIEVLIGMGGGKVIDTAKIVADRVNIPVIIFPTIASTDAPCSGVAVIYSEDGIFESVYYLKLNPQIVVVDMDIIKLAPVRFLIAGIGDALATRFEAEACYRAKSKNECGGYGTLTALNLAQLCYSTILKYGELAIIANKNNIVTDALNHVVEANTLLSGIGFESVGLAAAHSIHNGLSALNETHTYLHGEKVAFGTLAGLHLSDAEPTLMDEVYIFCKKVGLPITLKEIGLGNVTREELLKVAVKTCALGESIYHEVGEISPEKVFGALIAADETGKKYN